MIDHTGLTITDFARSKAFYEAALAPLGYAPPITADPPAHARRGAS